MNRFVSEPLQPIGAGLATAAGEPSLPTGFTWRGEAHHVAATLDAWKGVGPDRTHGSDEQYVHKHWFRLRMATGAIWTVYFERSPRGNKHQWWLYTTEASALL